MLAVPVAISVRVAPSRARVEVDPSRSAIDPSLSRRSVLRMIAHETFQGLMEISATTLNVRELALMGDYRRITDCVCAILGVTVEKTSLDGAPDPLILGGKLHLAAKEALYKSYMTKLAVDRLLEEDCSDWLPAPCSSDTLRGFISKRGNLGFRE